MDNSYHTESQIICYLKNHHPFLSGSQHYIDILKTVTKNEFNYLHRNIKNDTKSFKRFLDEKSKKIKMQKEIQKPSQQFLNEQQYNNYDYKYGQSQKIQEEVQATELTYRLKLLESRIVEHHKRIKQTIKEINERLKFGYSPEEEFNELVLLINISRGMYKPSNFPKGYFDKLLENPREDLTKILKENKENPLMIEYLKLYETLLKKGKLSQDIPLPYDTNKKITNQHLQEVSSKLISGMVREDHREQYYKNDPFAGPNAFTEQFDKEKSNQFVKKQRQNKDDKMDWT